VTNKPTFQIIIKAYENTMGSIELNVDFDGMMSHQAMLMVIESLLESYLKKTGITCETKTFKDKHKLKKS